MECLSGIPVCNGSVCSAVTQKRVQVSWGGVNDRQMHVFEHDQSLQAILEDHQQTAKVPSNVLKRQPSLVGAASAAAAIAGVTALITASSHILS